MKKPLTLYKRRTKLECPLQVVQVNGREEGEGRTRGEGDVEEEQEKEGGHRESGRREEAATARKQGQKVKRARARAGEVLWVLSVLFRLNFSIVHDKVALQFNCSCHELQHYTLHNSLNNSLT